MCSSGSSPSQETNSVCLWVLQWQDSWGKKRRRVCGYAIKVHLLMHRYKRAEWRAKKQHQLWFVLTFWLLSYNNNSPFLYFTYPTHVPQTEGGEIPSPVATLTCCQWGDNLQAHFTEPAAPSEGTAALGSPQTGLGEDGHVEVRWLDVGPWGTHRDRLWVPV